jgi:hypothetical protein
MRYTTAPIDGRTKFGCLVLKSYSSARRAAGGAPISDRTGLLFRQPTLSRACYTELKIRLCTQAGQKIGAARRAKFSRTTHVEPYQTAGTSGMAESNVSELRGKKPPSHRSRGIRHNAHSPKRDLLALEPNGGRAVTGDQTSIGAHGHACFYCSYDLIAVIKPSSIIRPRPSEVC